MHRYLNRAGQPVISRWLLAGMIALGCAGCASIPGEPPTSPEDALVMPSSGSIGGDQRWWRVRFRIAWPDDSEPSWHVDALLADQVLAPLLDELSPRFALWRFHRRAARDPAGHQLSFLFYADRETAAVALTRIEASELLSTLVDDGVVRKILLPDPAGAALPALESTSDPAWPIEIQRSWPWYIMGISQHWARLIREVRSSVPPPASVHAAALLEHYLAVNQTVTELWRDNGQHVYLHHLSGAFGYQPLVIRETNLKRF